MEGSETQGFLHNVMSVCYGNNTPLMQWISGVGACAFFLAGMILIAVFPVHAQMRHADAAHSSASEALQLASQAQKAIAAGKISEARNLLLSGIKTFPHEAALWDLLGAADAQESDLSKAKQDFRHAIALEPNYTAAYLNLGHLEEMESAHDAKSLAAALTTYRRLLQIDPGNVEGEFQYALVALEQGMFVDSLAHLVQIPKADIERPRAQALFSADLAATGHPNRAKRVAGALLAKPGLEEIDLLPAISALAAHHDIHFAILLLEGLRQRGLASMRSLEELSALEESAGNLKEARSALDDAAREKPDDVHLLMRLADLADQEHDYRGALGYLAHARDLDPRNASVHFFFGMICVELDLHVEAYDSLKKAVTLDPDNAYYNYALGAVSIQRSDTEGAIECFKKYCQLKPHDLHGRFALGVAYYRTHKLGEAQSVLTPLVKNPITAAAANYYLGRIDADLGLYGKAVRYLKQAIRDKSDYADAYAALGMVLLDEKDYSASSVALQHALAIQPENYLANLELTILYARTKDPRATAQQKRLAEVRKERAERAKLFLRMIRIVP